MILYLGALTGAPFYIHKKIVFISLAKNISALSAAQVITAVCNFFSLALVARMLGPELQGEWVLYISGFTLGTLALGFGLPPAINHFLAAGKLKKSVLIGQLFVFCLFVGLVFLLLAYVASYTKIGNIMLPDAVPFYFLILGLSGHFFLLLFNQLLGAVLLAERWFQTAALINIVGAIALLGGYSFMYWQAASAVQYFGWFIIFNLVVLGAECFLFLKKIVQSKEYGFQLTFFSKPVVVMFFSFAAWAYVTNFLQFLNYKMDVWFIEAYQKEPGQLGIYGVAVSLSQLIWLLPNAFHAVIFTDVSGGNAAIKINRIKNWSVKIFFLAISLALLGYILSFWLVPVFFSEAYIEVIEIFPYLLPGIVMFAPTILLSAYFAGINRVDINFKSSGLGFVICLILNYTLIPTFGIVGAAVASSGSYAISAGYLVYHFRRQNAILMN